MLTESIGLQSFWLVILSLAVAAVAWTVTQEEVFREARDYAARRAEEAASIAVRKFFYVFTCEYCFSHYVAMLFIGISGFRLLREGWAGTVIAFFATVAVANGFLSLFALLRQSLKHEALEAKKDEQDLGVRNP